MRGIGGVEADVAAEVAEIFERRFVIIDQRHDNLAVARGFGFADQRVIAVENPRFDHRIARHFERIMFARAEQRSRNRKRRLPLHRFDRQTGGNAAVQGEFDHIVAVGGHRQ